MLSIRGLFSPDDVVYLSSVPQMKIHHTMSHTRYLTNRIVIAGPGASPVRDAR